MIWRLILIWLMATTLVRADLPRPFRVIVAAMTHFQYDANGNLTNGGTRVFSYDVENQLTNIAVASRWQTSFIFDGLRRKRIERDYTWLSGGWTLTNEVRYICDGPLVIQERDTNNNPLVTYTRGLDLSLSLQDAGGIGGILARTSANGSDYYHADGSGNITSLMNGYGTVVARYEYDPYGKLIGKWGALADANRYRFSSKEYQPNSGLYSYGYRFYEPNFPRWLNRDPIGEAGGINMYGFVGNNSLMFFDPYGFAWEDWPAVQWWAKVTQPLVQNPLQGIPSDIDEIDRATGVPTGAGGAATADMDMLLFVPAGDPVAAALDALGDVLKGIAKPVLDGLGKPKAKVPCQTSKPPPKPDFKITDAQKAALQHAEDTGGTLTTAERQAGIFMDALTSQGYTEDEAYAIIKNIFFKD